MTEKVFVGQSVKRLEDPNLLTGKGQFLDDLKLPGMLEAAFVRSPFAHARFTDIDTEDARRMPGVVAVYTAKDLPDVMQGKRILLQVPNPAIVDPITQEPLVSERVAFAGEAVAVVVAVGAQGPVRNVVRRVLCGLHGRRLRLSRAGLPFTVVLLAGTRREGTVGHVRTAAQRARL